MGAKLDKIAESAKLSAYFLVDVSFMLYICRQIINSKTNKTMKKIQIVALTAILSCSLMLTSCLDVFDNPSVNINEESEFSSMMDLGTYVGDDFYQYVLGTWIANNPVPTKDGAKSVGMLDEQDVITDEALKEIIGGQKNEIATALYQAYSQETLKDDSTALMKKLAEVDAMKTKDDLTKLLAQLAKQGYACPFYILPNTSQRQVYPELGTIDDFKLKEESIIKLGISSAEAKAIMDMGAKWEGIVKDILGKRAGKHVLGHYNPFCSPPSRHEAKAKVLSMPWLQHSTSTSLRLPPMRLAISFSMRGQLIVSTIRSGWRSVVS